MNFREDAKVFKALADENRLQILTLLQTGELCACRLLEQLHISQPTLSHHMKLLCDSGIVVFRKDGKWMHYSVAPAARNRLANLLTGYIGKEI